MASTGKLLWVLAGVALIVSIANPAMATHDPEHAKEQIRQIVAEALNDFDARVAAFRSAVGSATTKAEIESMRKDASADVQSIWSEAFDEVGATAKGYETELSAQVVEAKQQLQSARNQAKAEIDKAAAVAAENLPEPATTTTTTPITTTTTAPITTTTAPVATTSTAAAVPGGEEPAEPVSDAPPQLTPLERWATEAFVTGQSEASSTDASAARGTRSGIAVALETVLPRDLIDWALSPFLIVRVIARTSLTGGRSMLFPTAALALAAAVLVIVEARTRRRLTAAGR